jgi:hypothetical protein
MNAEMQMELRTDTRSIKAKRESAAGRNRVLVRFVKRRV